MDNLSLFRKLRLRLVLIALIVTSYLFGCNGSTDSSLVDNLKDPSPTISRTVDTSKTNQYDASPTSTLASEPTMTSALQPLNSNTITPTVEQTNPLSTEIPENNIIWEIINQVSLDRALTDLSRLTGVEPICNNNNCYTITNRLTGSEGLKWAKNYIYEELDSMGYEVVRQDWSTPQLSDQNIIARKPGIIHPDDVIMLIAHLDGVNRVLLLSYPAADDDASGVVDLLELARVFQDYSFNRTLVLLITAGEENGRLGSNAYLNQLSSTEIKAIKYAINIDMVGYDENKDQVMELWHGDHPPSNALVHQMGEIIRFYQIDLVPRFVVGCG